jgi:hypothetical protein
MLMNRIRDTYREIIGYIEPAAPVTMVPGRRSAANAGSISKSDMQARRQRRQRRAAQAGMRNVSGWTVRTW